MLDKGLAEAPPLPPNFCPRPSNQAKDHLHMGNRGRENPGSADSGHLTAPSCIPLLDKLLLVTS